MTGMRLFLVAVGMVFSSVSTMAAADCDFKFSGFFKQRIKIESSDANIGSVICYYVGSENYELSDWVYSCKPGLGVKIDSNTYEAELFELKEVFWADSAFPFQVVRNKIETCAYH